MKPLCYVIDIGTNSARLMLAQLDAEGRVKSAYKLVRTVRTGEGVNATGRISAAAIQRVASALGEFKHTAFFEHPDLPVYVFATSAVRDAENRDELLCEIRMRTGLETEVISGEAEALLSFTGATGGSGGVIDLGGGSTEAALGKNGVIEWKKSFDIGIIRAKDMFGMQDEQTAVRLAYGYAHGLFSKIPSSLKGRDFFAVGGTATSLAAILLEMREYDPRKIQGFKVSRACAEQTLARLLCMSMDERLSLPGLPPARADVMTCGIAILCAAMDCLGIEEYTASDSDNLEGYVILKRQDGL